MKIEERLFFKVQNSWKGDTTLKEIKDNKDKEDWYSIYQEDYVKISNLTKKVVFQNFTDEVLSSAWSHITSFLL